MNKINLFFISAFLVSLLKAQSPITLGNANMPGSGDTLRYTNIQLNSLGNYTQTGVNLAWDFSAVVSGTQGIRQFKSALQTPYGLFFLSLNEYGEKIADSFGAGPVMVTDYYDFYKKQTTPAAFIADGAGVSFSSIPVPSYYSDKDELYNFPMSYPKYDSTTFRFSTPNTTIIPIRYSKTGYRVTVVDGWGTIKTPYGTEACLRLITTQYSMDSVRASLGPISIPLGFPNFVRSYQWLSTTAKIPVLEVSGNLTGNTFTPILARYRGYPLAPGATGIQQLEKDAARFYPNPVKNTLHIDADLGDGLLEIYDATGKYVQTPIASVFSGSSILDVSQLPTGIYFLKITADKGTHYLKFVKEAGN